MDNKGRTYIAIDLKSFYASVECMERGLDPLTTNLVVADESRTDKTICLAVSPSLKAYGIPGRARLFEVVQRVREVNAQRRRNAPGYNFSGKSYMAPELAADPSLELSYIAAPPRMAYYIDYSTRIYSIYLKYVAAEDMHVYSIDEVFIDATAYLQTYRITARELASRMINEVMTQTGITATAGIGTNMYLCKVAMDIVAKHIEPDSNGVRIAELDEMSYRRMLWSHRPLTDFWRIGKGIAHKLEANYMYTMGDVARCSVRNDEILYKMFGVNAELIIDHAWGWEPCTIDYVKAYRPENCSFSSGQVLTEPYTFGKARVVALEMADAVALDLVDKRMVTDQLILTVSYDSENLKDPAIAAAYKGPVTTDYYGRPAPKHAHATANLGRYTSSTRLIIDAIAATFDQVVDRNLLVRRLNITTNHVMREEKASEIQEHEQLDMFTDYEARAREHEEEAAKFSKERKMQETILNIKKRYGKNAILKGLNWKDGATARERNNQIGGHKA